MKNVVKAYLITVLIVNILYFSLFFWHYWQVRFWMPESFSHIGYFLDLLLQMAKMTVHLIALMVIIVLPLYKIFAQYLNASWRYISWIIVFFSGFLVMLVRLFINRGVEDFNNPKGLYIALGLFISFAAVFAALYWWFDRPKKRASKNLADEFR